MKDYWIIALENVATFAIFALVAIYFGKWWIVLFSFLAMTTIRLK